MTSASRPQSNPNPPPALFSRATTTAVTPQRPWRSFFELSSFMRPISLGETSIRIKRNLSYFLSNYIAILLLILFLSLLWHAVSLIVFIVIFAFWYFLFFSRDGVLVVFGRVIDERLVIGGLSLVTIVGLVLTGVWVNVVAAVAIGVVVVVVHAAFRRTEDLYLDEGERGDDDGGLTSFVGGFSRGGYSRV